MILMHRLDQVVGRKGGDDAAQAASDLCGELPASATEEAGDEVAALGGLASAAADSSDGRGGLVGDDDVRMGAQEEGSDGAAERGDAVAPDEATPTFWTDLHTAINRQDWDLVLRVFSIANHTVKSSVFCGWRRG